MISLTWEPDDFSNAELSFIRSKDCGCDHGNENAWCLSSASHVDDDTFEEIFDYFADNNISDIDKVEQYLGNLWQKP